MTGTARKLRELMGRDVSELDLLALFMDGIETAGHTIVAALGVDAEGRKHPLGLWEGSTSIAGVSRRPARSGLVLAAGLRRLMGGHRGSSSGYSTDPRSVAWPVVVIKPSPKWGGSGPGRLRTKDVNNHAGQRADPSRVTLRRASAGT